MSLNKRGGLEISINAIVILILAVTVLGLGLTFIRNMMGGAMDQLGSVSEDIKNDMIDRLRESNERLAFRENDISVKKNEKKEIYFGLRNEEDPKFFDIDMICDSSMSEDLTEADIENYVSFDYFRETKEELEKDEIIVLKAVVKVSPNAVTTTYMCSVKIEDDLGEYASKTFYVTVT